MEDVIEIYARPLNEKNPVVCFDESPFQLLQEVREPMSAAPGRPRREDSEYERCGVAEVMMICQPPDGHLKFPHLWPPQIPPGGYRLQAAEFDTLSFARTCDW